MRQSMALFVTAVMMMPGGASADEKPAQKGGAVATYQSCKAEKAEKPLEIVFIPALAPLLVRAEKLKGAPLSEAEVLRIRDDAACVVVPPAQKEALEQKRGYRDLDPENCWAEWGELRRTLKTN